VWAVRVSKLFALNAILNAVGGLSYPVIPLYLKGIGVGVELTGLILSLLSLGTVISALVWGRLSDSPRRRGRVVVITCLGGFISFLLLSLPWPLELLVPLLFLANLLAFGVIPAVMASASEGEGVREEMGRFWMGASLGYSLATSVSGALLDRFGLQVIFQASAALMLPALWVSRKLVMVPGRVEVQPPDPPRGIPKSFWLFAISAVIFLFTDVAKNLFVPVFYAYGLGTGDAFATATLSVEALLEIPVIFLFSRALAKFNCWSVFGLSFLLAAAFFLLNSAVFDRVSALLAMCTYALVWGSYSVSSSLLVSQIVGKGKRGTGYGVYNAAFPMANVAGPLYLGSVISRFGFREGLIYLSLPELFTGVIVILRQGRGPAVRREGT